MDFHWILSIHTPDQSKVFYDLFNDYSQNNESPTSYFHLFFMVLPFQQTVLGLLDPRS